MARFVISNSTADTCVQTYAYTSASHVVEKFGATGTPSFCHCSGHIHFETYSKSDHDGKSHFFSGDLRLPRWSACWGRLGSFSAKFSWQSSITCKNQLSPGIALEQDKDCKYNCLSEICLKFVLNYISVKCEYVRHLKTKLKDKRVRYRDSCIFHVTDCSSYPHKHTKSDFHNYNIIHDFS